MAIYKDFTNKGYEVVEPRKIRNNSNSATDDASAALGAALGLGLAAAFIGAAAAAIDDDDSYEQRRRIERERERERAHERELERIREKAREDARKEAKKIDAEMKHQRNIRFASVGCSKSQFIELLGEQIFNGHINSKWMYPLTSLVNAIANYGYIDKLFVSKDKFSTTTFYAKVGGYTLSVEYGEYSGLRLSYLGCDVTKYTPDGHVYVFKDRIVNENPAFREIVEAIR